jgi:hypothetical protein
MGRLQSGGMTPRGACSRISGAYTGRNHSKLDLYTAAALNVLWRMTIP